MEMTCARKDIVEPGTVAVYHCVSRCVRRAFLCGKDALSGRSYEHRRLWIRQRLAELAAVFAVEVIAYSIMNNHLHLLLRIRPDIVLAWTAEEVARRWRLLFPLRRSTDGSPKEPSKEEIIAITSDPARVALYRERLANLSWFNRCMNENIARRANEEDECSGRFWEGRFKCQRVFDESGILACAAYIDLNPIRAGIAKTLETSDHTSVQDKIHDLTGIRPARTKQWAHIPVISISEITGGRVSTEDYLALVDDAGRAIRNGKKHIESSVAPILERLGIVQSCWIDSATSLGRKFRRVIGPVQFLQAAAARAGKCWFQGLAEARKAFTARQLASA